MEEVIWEKMQGNRFTRNLRPEMLEGEFRHPSNPRVIGESVYRSTARRAVIYNRDYVVAFIIKKVVIPLGIATKKDFDKLMIEVWAKFKEETKGKL